ncbi:MAG: VanZ family protein [Alphaproteobacteria bacterium]
MKDIELGGAPVMAAGEQPRDLRTPGSRRGLGLAALGIMVAFIVYGSLVPFAFVDLPVRVGLDRLLNAPWFDPMAIGRADWVANLLLYVPAAFLSVGVLHARGVAERVGAACAVWLVLSGLAVGVEFAQTFTHRTVSLNDLLAETLGAALGAVAWLCAGSAVMRLLHNVASGGRPAIVAVLIGYLSLYVGFGLYPYDFVVSAAEFSRKLDTGVAFSLSPRDCVGFACFAKLVVEVVSVAPLGALIALLVRRPLGATCIIALAAGTVLGLGLEGVQILILSSLSQGLSVVTRGLGAVAGVGVTSLAVAFGAARIARFIRWVSVLGAVPYLIGFAALSGWFAGPWGGFKDASRQLGELSFIPFYYHYFTTEQMATASLMRIALASLPIGVAAWAWRPQARPSMPALAAGGAALVMECGRLFRLDGHPDPTNVLIAGASAGVMFVTLAWIRRWGAEPTPTRRPLAATAAIRATTRPPKPATASEAFTPATRRAGPTMRLGAIVAGAAALAAAWLHPFGAAWTVPALALWATLLWRFPRLWLTAVPAVLPVLDLARWSGWFFFDEFQFMALVALAVLLWRGSALTLSVPLPAKLAVGLVVVACVIALGRGLLPLAPVDANAIYTYTTPWNAARVGGGFALGLAFLPFLWREMARDPGAGRRLALGMVLGLAGTMVAVLHERFLFSGWFNLESEFRVTAGFSSMHTGGGHLGGYLATALPFAVTPLLFGRTSIAYAATAAAFLGAAYALLVAFARTAYLGAAAALASLALGSMVASARAGRPRRGAMIAVAGGVVGLATIVVAPMLGDSFIGARIARTVDDFDQRSRHWRSVMAMRDTNLVAALFGMGLGRYPSTYLGSAHSVPVDPPVSFGRGQGGLILRLAGGHALYYEQRVSVEPGRSYILSLDIRGEDAAMSLNVSVCEKALHYSFACQDTPVAARAEWQTVHRVIDMGDVGADRGRIGAPSRRPVFISLNASGSSAVVRIDNVSLIAPNGQDLVRNGGFDDGGAHWYFAEDRHVSWQIENLYLQVLFDQGWFGLVAFVVFSAYAVTCAIRAVAMGDGLGAVLLASIMGFLTVGLATALIDAPRLAMLYIFLAGAAIGLRPAACRTKA